MIWYGRNPVMRSTQLVDREELKHLARATSEPWVEGYRMPYEDSGGGSRTGMGSEPAKQISCSQWAELLLSLRRNIDGLSRVISSLKRSTNQW